LHELSLILNLLRILDEQAAAHHFEKVRAVRLEVGKLSCVEPEALQLSFEVARKGTIAEEATLHITRVPGRAWCDACEEEFSVDTHFEPCPRCGAIGLWPSSGNDLRVAELEVD